MKAIVTSKFGDPEALYLQDSVTIARLNTKQCMEVFTFIKELIEAGKIQVVIDRCYPLEDMVKAHRYVETEHYTENFVITLEQNYDQSA
jgi:NADPH:quinone reductase-like Zn-dependent oxidoreductase